MLEWWLKRFESNLPVSQSWPAYAPSNDWKRSNCKRFSCSQEKHLFWHVFRNKNCLIFTRQQKDFFFFVTHEFILSANVNERKQMESFISSRVWPWPAVNFSVIRIYFLGDRSDTFLNKFDLICHRAKWMVLLFYLKNIFYYTYSFSMMILLLKRNWWF